MCSRRSVYLSSFRYPTAVYFRPGLLHKSHVSLFTIVCHRFGLLPSEDITASHPWQNFVPCFFVVPACFASFVASKSAARDPPPPPLAGRTLTHDAPWSYTRTPSRRPPAQPTLPLKAAMLRPATTTERAVASVLNDVSAAIHNAEQDLIINERQARTLLSRIRRSARLPE